MPACLLLEGCLTDQTCVWYTVLLLRTVRCKSGCRTAHFPPKWHSIAMSWSACQLPSVMQSTTNDLLVYTTIDTILFTFDQRQKLLWQEAVHRCAASLQAGVVMAQTDPGPVSQTPAPSAALLKETVTLQPSLLLSIALGAISAAT